MKVVAEMLDVADDWMEGVMRADAEELVESDTVVEAKAENETVAEANADTLSPFDVEGCAYGDFVGDSERAAVNETNVEALSEAASVEEALLTAVRDRERADEGEKILVSEPTGVGDGVKAPISDAEPSAELDTEAAIVDVAEKTTEMLSTSLADKELRSEADAYGVVEWIALEVAATTEGETVCELFGEFVATTDALFNKDSPPVSVDMTERVAEPMEVTDDVDVAINDGVGRADGETLALFSAVAEKGADGLARGEEDGSSGVAVVIREPVIDAVATGDALGEAVPDVDAETMLVAEGDALADLDALGVVDASVVAEPPLLPLALNDALIVAEPPPLTLALSVGPGVIVSLTLPVMVGEEGPERVAVAKSVCMVDPEADEAADADGAVVALSRVLTVPPSLTEAVMVETIEDDGDTVELADAETKTEALAEDTPGAVGIEEIDAI